MNLNLAQVTVDFGKKWLVDFETRLEIFDCSNKPDAIDAKIHVTVYGEKLSLKMVGLSLPSELDLAFCIVSFAKTAFMNNGLLIHSINILSFDALRMIN